MSILLLGASCSGLPEALSLTDGSPPERLHINTVSMSTTPAEATPAFHVDAGHRARVESFGGSDVPFLACRDLAVLKAFFNRTKDWADLEEMAAAGTLDTEAVLGVLANYLGAGDERIERLRSLNT